MTPSGRAKSRPRGRSIVAAVLVGFVIVATAVIWRRGYGVARAEEMRAMMRQRDQLKAERTSLERRIGQLTGRAELGGVAEQRLEMHVPADSQVVVLPGARP
jgi:hypothetical protein